MARKTKSKGKGGARMLPLLHADAAGIDIGAEEIFVAVPPERALEPVRSFGTFTRDLHELADWLKECGCAQSQWNPLACTGSRFTRSWKLVASKCFL
jgi:hypothetical protein